MQDSGSEEYLDAVINEALRVRPPVGLAMRMVKQPYDIGGYEVQPGMLIAPCIFMVHRREDIYPARASSGPSASWRNPPAHIRGFRSAADSATASAAASR